MLVLTRKAREQIRIGDSITVTILRLKGHAVRIGIEAPDAMRVLRGELLCHDTSRPHPAPSREAMGSVQHGDGETGEAGEIVESSPGESGQACDVSPGQDGDAGGLAATRAAAGCAVSRVFAARYTGPLLALATRRLRSRRAQYMPLGRL